MNEYFQTVIILITLASSTAIFFRRKELNQEQDEDVLSADDFKIIEI